MPDSLDELTMLLEQCKQQKKELLTEKEAVNAQMASVRVEAKQQTANTNYGKYGKGDRRRIKLNKDALLRPQDNQKTAIEDRLPNLTKQLFVREIYVRKQREQRRLHHPYIDLRCFVIWPNFVS